MTNAATQYAAIAALKGPQDQVKQMVNEFHSRKNIIVKETNQIPGISCSIPEGAFYIMPNIRETGLDSKKMENVLLEKLKIATVAGTSFGSFGEGYIRLSYANSQKNIIRALKRIKTYAFENNWGSL